MLNFVSMAFTSSGDDLFAVDEQPPVWRWKKDAGTASGFSNAPFVAEYVYPAQSSHSDLPLEKIQSRLVLHRTFISMGTSQTTVTMNKYGSLSGHTEYTY